MTTALPVPLTILRNYTVEPIEPLLRKEFGARGLEPRCVFGSFSDAMSDVLALESNLPSEIGLVVLTLSLETYSRDFGHAGWQCEAACDHLLSLVRTAVDRCPRTLVINTALAPLHPSNGFSIEPGRMSHAQRIDELNLELRRLAAERPGRVVLLDWMAYARELGAANTYDQRFWHSAGLPFSNRFLARYAADIAAVAEVVTGRAKKCLVLDCDNTLWGGVVGEDGLAGIKLSTDSNPGAYFQQFQRAVLDLHHQGVLIALCSKNNEADVLEVLDSHPECLLKREHLSGWRINWNDKAVSIAELAAELNIGLDAMVFVDDAPQECERIRQALPDVTVVLRPTRDEEITDVLQRSRLFPSLVVTDADAMRALSFRDNRQRKEMATLASDAAEYRSKLGTRLRARPATSADLDRIAQLFQKTNQFNLTTRRYDRSAVDALAKDDDTILYCAEVEDRFGSLGLVAVAVARRVCEGSRIDSFLMSCRALGRDVEYSFLASLLREVHRRWGGGFVRTQYLSTAKNQQVADFWTLAGLSRERGADDIDCLFFHPDIVRLAEHNRRSFIREED